MNRQNAALLLAWAAGVDNRVPGEMPATLWAEALTKAGIGDDLVADCKDAITGHFAESTEYLKPAHVIARVKDIRRLRLTEAGTPDLPSGLDQVREREYARAWRQQIARGLSREEATAHVDRLGGIVREIESPRPVRQLIAGSRIAKGSRDSGQVAS